MLFVSEHPLVKHKLALLRDTDTHPKKFRELVRELSMLLGYEATQDLSLVSESVTTPMGTADVQRLRTRIGRQHQPADAAVRAAPPPKRLRLPFVRSGATRTRHPLPGTRVPSFGAPTARQHRAESESAQPQTTPAVIEPRP